MAENTLEKENIEVVKAKYKEAKEKHDEHFNYLKTVGRDIRRNSKLMELSDTVNHYKRIIDYHDIWELLSPIRPELKTIAEAIGYDEEEDYFEYSLEEHGDIKCLRYAFNHRIQTTGITYKYLSSYGYMIYNEEGHIYLSNNGICDGNWAISDYPTKGVTKSQDHICHKITFVDDNYFYISMHNHNTELYRIFDGKCKLVHAFNENVNIKYWPSLLEKKLIVCDHDIYNAAEDKFIFTSKKAFVQSYDSKYFSIPIRKDGLLSMETAEQLKNLMIDFMKKNNLLLICDSIEVTGCDDNYKKIEKYYDTFCFMDLNGNIDRELLFVVSCDNLATYTYSVTSDTYVVTLYEIKEDLTDALRKEIEAEKERKVRELEKMRRALFDQLSFMNDFENQDPEANKLALEN